MKNIQQIGKFIDLYERFHPERSAEEIRQIMLDMISKLPKMEKEEFFREYYKWCDQRYAEQFPDEYLDSYKETNEGS